MKLKLEAKDINIAKIDMNTNYVAVCIKKGQVFTLFMKNIQYQANKKIRAETNLKIVIPQKYFNFLDIFSNKDLKTFSFY